MSAVTRFTPAPDPFPSPVDITLNLSIRSQLSGLRLERAAKRLVPGLGSSHPDQLILVVAGVEIKMGEELGLGEGVGRVDAQKRLSPRGLNSGSTADLDAASDSQAVGDAGEATGGKIDIADALHPCPELVSEGEAGDLLSPSPGRVVVATGEAETGAALRKVIPAVAPGPFHGVALGIR